MMPYAPISSLLAMHQEWMLREQPPHPDDVTGWSSCDRRDLPPDPLGVVLVKLRPGERLRAGIDWMTRLGRNAIARAARPGHSGSS